MGGQANILYVWASVKGPILKTGYTVLYEMSLLHFKVVHAVQTHTHTQAFLRNESMQTCDILCSCVMLRVNKVIL